MPERRRTLIDRGVIAVDDDGTHEIVSADVSTPDQAEILDEALQLADSVWGSRATNLDPHPCTRGARVRSWRAGTRRALRCSRSDGSQRPLERAPRSTGNELLTIELPVPSTRRRAGVSWPVTVRSAC